MLPSNAITTRQWSFNMHDSHRFFALFYQRTTLNCLHSCTRGLHSFPPLLDIKILRVKGGKQSLSARPVPPSILHTDGKAQGSVTRRYVQTGRLHLPASSRPPLLVQHSQKSHETIPDIRLDYHPRCAVAPQQHDLALEPELGPIEDSSRRRTSKSPTSRELFTPAPLIRRVETMPIKKAATTIPLPITRFKTPMVRKIKSPVRIRPISPEGTRIVSPPTARKVEIKPKAKIRHVQSTKLPISKYLVGSWSRSIVRRFETGFPELSYKVQYAIPWSPVPITENERPAFRNDLHPISRLAQHSEFAQFEH